MAVFYRLYQNKRSGAKHDYWYARAAHPQTVNLEKIAEIVQQNCSVKGSDVRAVLSELVEVMTLQLQAGNRVKLDGFGTFKIGLCSTGVEKAEDFSVARNVEPVHLLFLPVSRVGADGRHVRTFLAGTVVKELPDYTAPASGEAAGGDGTGGGSGEGTGGSGGGEEMP